MTGPPLPTAGPVVELTPAHVLLAVNRWRRFASEEFRALLDLPPGARVPD